MNFFSEFIVDGKIGIRTPKYDNFAYITQEGRGFGQKFHLEIVEDSDMVGLGRTRPKKILKKKNIQTLAEALAIVMEN